MRIVLVNIQSLGLSHYSESRVPPPNQGEFLPLEKESAVGGLVVAVSASSWGSLEGVLEGMVRSVLSSSIFV